MTDTHSQSDQPEHKGPAPGACQPWDQKITGDEQLVKQIWEELDALAYTYIWQCLVSF